MKTALWSISFVLLLLKSTAAIAVTSGGATTNLHEIANELSTEKERILEKEQQKRGVLSDLYAVNKSLKSLSGEKNKIEKNLRNVGESVQALGVLIQQLDERVGEQRTRLRERMKALSKVNGQNAARLIFASQSSSQLDANLRTLRIITEKDYRLLKAFRENVKTYRAQKKRLDKEQLKYANLKKSFDEKERFLAEQVERKNTMLKTIDSSRILHLTKLKKLRLKSEATVASDRELQKIKAIEDLFAPQMFEQKGLLPQPVEGELAQKFGFHKDPISNTRIRFKGALFSTKVGAAVKAVFAGKVVFAGWLDGYGKTIIIDHGDQYFSVYANQSDIEAKVGDNVQAGTAIGNVGTNQSFLGDGLYFELRHFSEPEDPTTWFKGS